MAGATIAGRLSARDLSPSYHLRKAQEMVSRKILNQIININYKANFKRSAPKRSLRPMQFQAKRHEPPKEGLREISIVFSRKQHCVCSQSALLIVQNLPC